MKSSKPSENSNLQVLIVLVGVVGVLLFFAIAILLMILFRSGSIASQNNIESGNNVNLPGGSGAPVTVLPPLAKLSNSWKTNRKDIKAVFRYDFAGAEVAFDYRAATKVDDITISNEGRIHYREIDESPIAWLRDDAEKEGRSFSLDSSGTGFVVHPEGVLVTCAHVVGEAQEVNVRLGGNEFRGRVIGVDVPQDLALVKIEKKDLHYLSLAKRSPSLGAVARVFGFPLTDRLGSSLKMTTGSVSGKDTVNADAQRIQLDATANPGNSGGPVVNEQAQVMGVIDSILTGSSIADVSFAVPSEQLGLLLKRNQVDFRSLDQPQTGDPLLVTTLDGVAKAVALIELSAKDSSKSWRLLEADVRDTSRYKIKNMSFKINGKDAGTKTSRSKMRLVVDSRGNVIHSSGSLYLPFFLMDVAQIALPVLPRGSEASWTVEDVLVFTKEESVEKERSRTLRDHVLPRFGRFGQFSPQATSTRQKLIAAEVRDEYKICQAQNNGLVFERRRRILQNELSGDGPATNLIVVRGNSNFDRHEKWCSKGALVGKGQVVVEGRKQDANFEFEFSRVDAAVIAKEEKKAADELEDRKREFAEKKNAEQSRTEALDALQSGSSGMNMYDREK